MSKQELRSTNSRKYLQFWNKIEITLNALFLVYLTHFLLLFVWFEKYVDVRFCFDRHHSPTVQLEAHRATTKVITLVSHKAHRINTRSKLCSWRECEWLPIGSGFTSIGWQSGASFLQPTTSRGNTKPKQARIGHFWFAFRLCFKTSPRAKLFLWKWVWFAWKWTCGGNTFHMNGFCTKTRFDTEVKGNSEMA